MASFDVIEGDANGVWARLVAVDEHQRPVSVWTMEGVRGDELIAVVIFDGERRRKHVVEARAVLDPFEIDHARGEVERCVAADVEVAIGEKVRPSGPSEATGLKRLGLNGRVIESGAATFEEGTDVVGEPEGGEDRGHGAGEVGGQMALGDHERNVFGDAVFAPDVEGVLHQMRLAVERAPGDGTGFEGIVLEGDESEVGEAAVVF